MNSKPKSKDVTARWMMNAAQFYIMRYAASERHLSGVLARKVRKRTGAPPDDKANALIVSTIDALKRLNLIDDKAFATARAQTLKRRGLAEARARAGLAAKGVARDLAAEAVADAQFNESEQICAAARRLRIGPFAREGARAELTDKEMAKLARRGFSPAAVKAALAEAAD